MKCAIFQLPRQRTLPQRPGLTQMQILVLHALRKLERIVTKHLLLLNRNFLYWKASRSPLIDGMYTRTKHVPPMRRPAFLPLSE